MSDNLYGPPGSAPAEAPAHPALTGRILAPLLMPPLLVPVVLGVGLGLYEGMSFAGLGMVILSVAPLTFLLAFFIAPLAMLALLPFRQLSWPWRGLLASAFLLAVMVILLAATWTYVAEGPVEVQLPQQVG